MPRRTMMDGQLAILLLVRIGTKRPYCSADARCPGVGHGPVMDLTAVDPATHFFIPNYPFPRRKDTLKGLSNICCFRLTGWLSKYSVGSWIEKFVAVKIHRTGSGLISSCSVENFFALHKKRRILLYIYEFFCNFQFFKLSKF